MTRGQQIAPVAIRALSTKLTDAGHEAFADAIDQRLGGKIGQIHLSECLELLEAFPSWVDGPPPRMPGFFTMSRPVDRSQRRRRGAA